MTSIERRPPRPTPRQIIDECPECGGDAFLVVETGGDTVFRCLGCAAAWHHSLGYIWRAPGSAADG